MNNVNVRSPSPLMKTRKNEEYYKYVVPEEWIQGTVEPGCSLISKLQAPLTGGDDCICRI